MQWPLKFLLRNDTCHFCKLHFIGQIKTRDVNRVVHQNICQNRNATGHLLPLHLSKRHLLPPKGSNWKRPCHPSHFLSLTPHVQFTSPRPVDSPHSISESIFLSHQPSGLSCCDFHRFTTPQPHWCLCFCSRAPKGPFPHKKIQNLPLSPPGSLSSSPCSWSPGHNVPLSVPLTPIFPAVSGPLYMPFLLAFLYLGNSFSRLRTNDTSSN